MKSSRPVAVAFLLFAAILIPTVVAGLRVCDGHFGYPLDDTYIHMAMAKSFAMHGVWGVTRYAFSSSTSSPLFTLLLAGCYAITGVHELTPFVLNCIAAIALLFVCNSMLLRNNLPERIRLLVLCLLVLAIPLPTLALVGMEHLLHAILTLLFVAVCCAALVSEQKISGQRFTLTLLPLTALLVTARYEGLFLVAAAASLFLFRRMWTAAAGLVAASATPLLIYGWISMAHGWYPVPSSLLLKANLPSARSTGMFGGFVFTLIVNATQGSHVVALVLLAIALLYTSYAKFHTVWTYSQAALILFISSAVMHLCLARVGWFFRYESYLVALGIVVSVISLHELGLPKSRKSVVLIYAPIILFSVPITYRLIHATYRAPQAISDIYSQQYQMGLFAQENFAGKGVVTGDIGAVSFLSDAKVLDLIGLGNIDALTAHLDKTYSIAWLDKWAHDNQAAVALTGIDVAPPDWTRVRTWAILNNYQSGAGHVDVYAIDPSMKSLLPALVDRFQTGLPSRVVKR